VIADAMVRRAGAQAPLKGPIQEKMAIKGAAHPETHCFRFWPILLKKSVNRGQ